MHLDSNDTQDTGLPQHDDNFDEYSDFADDPEALEIIDQLLLAVADQRKEDALANAPLVVTDIEDYEEPRGVRLPKVFGFEAKHEQAIPESAAVLQPQQIIRDESGKNNQTTPCFVLLTC